MSHKRTRAPSPAPEDIITGIFRSGEVRDLGSTFVGVFSASRSANVLQKLPDFKDADHRIAAWRKPSRQRSIIPNAPPLMERGYDEDGERGAGKRLEKVLEDMEVEGTLVVGRWYGGNIGPIRFTHIETVAKQAAQKWLDAVEEAKQVEARKKQKVEEQAALEELRESLRDRDQSIVSLRQLLADKVAILEDTDPVPPTPSGKPPDYDSMSKEALQRVEKARDASIAFILSKLEKVDQQLKDAGKPTKLNSGSPPPDRMESIPEERQAESAKNGASDSLNPPNDGTKPSKEDHQPENLQNGNSHSINHSNETKSTTEDQQPENMDIERSDTEESTSLRPPNETKLTNETASFQTLSFSETMTWVDTPGSSMTTTSAQSDPTKQTAD